MTIHARRSLFALSLALACGGDDGPSTTSAAESAGTSSSDTSGGSTTTASTGEASGDSSTGAAASSGGDASEGTSSETSSGSDEGSTTGAPVEPYADCDRAMSCGDALICVEDPIPGEVGLQYCGAPCDPDGDGSECPPPPVGSEVTATCVDRHDGTGVCGLDCLGGYACPQGMSCFDGWLCVWEP
ncbi:MAG: hypothetical protein U0168_14505 [Nannocystaceae bacterium]